MKRLIEAQGFRADPFAEYTAENEPDIDKYFVRPPYFQTVNSRASSSKSYILFGARGTGKSATRLALYKDLWARAERGEKVPLAVMLDSYATILRDGLEAVSTRAFVVEIAYRTIEALLLWLSALPDDKREAHLQTLPESDEKLLVTFVARFYLARPEAVRELTAKEVMTVLGQAWTSRTLMWMSKKWNAVAALVATLANVIAQKASGVDAKIDSNLADILKSDAAAWDEGIYPVAVLTKLVEVARAFEFQGIVVLVDKVDETPDTNSNAENAAALLFPVIGNTRLLEIDGLGWIFFLWDQVKKHYGPGSQKVRLDKIGNAEISWEAAFLEHMVAERLWYFSGQKTRDFVVLCDSSLPASEVLRPAIAVAMDSPRELVRILDTVISVHDELQAEGGGTERLVRESVDAGLDRYSVESARSVYDQVKLAQVLRVAKVVFTNKDVQSTFRIGQASARNRIQRWSEAGLVARTGARAVDASSAGQPAHEFSVIDARVRRIVERRLDSGLPIEDIAPVEADAEVAE